MKLSNFIALATLGSLLPVGALACGDRPGLVRASIRLGSATPTLQVASQPNASSMGNDNRTDSNSVPQKQGIVGTWIATWYVGNTTQIYDRVITVFHADGNETENDIAVPPATENVCYGVWEQTDRDKFTMRHVGWVFDVNGVFMGTVEVVATVSLTDRGAKFRGNFVLEQYDVTGNIIPADHAEGDITATRYTLTNGIANIWAANP
jgi:hypothetical protein